jgi:hypothetical protein
MKDQVILRLILKDWRMNLPVIIFSIVSGIVSLGILLIGGQTPFCWAQASFSSR